MTLTGAGRRAARSSMGTDSPSRVSRGIRTFGSRESSDQSSGRRMRSRRKIHLVGDLLRPREHLLRDHHRGALSFKNRKNLPMHTPTYTRARTQVASGTARRGAERSKAAPSGVKRRGAACGGHGGARNNEWWGAPGGIRSRPPREESVMWRSAGWPAARASLPVYVVVARGPAPFAVEFDSRRRSRRGILSSAERKVSELRGPLRFMRP